MPRPRAHANSTIPESSPVTTTTARTTIVLPVALDDNLEIYAIQSGLKKNDVIKRALTDFLTQQGLQPHRRPKDIKVSY